MLVANSDLHHLSLFDPSPLLQSVVLQQLNSSKATAYCTAAATQQTMMVT